jgi:dienelactone hydrolase
LIDEPVPIVVSGLQPGTTTTLRLQRDDGSGRGAGSSATFVADESGRVDVTRMAPTSGSYKGVDATGLFWSSEATARTPVQQRWQLAAEVAEVVVATATLQRHTVAPGVRITPLRVSGLVGTFYEPAGGGRHPAVLVLSGSGGGWAQASSHPGGLSSRGYAVLSLAYFAAEGLPRSLSAIPLEYFKTALDWLAANPAVDPGRIGILGTSRGGELALLLGATYPEIKAVIAYVPSHEARGSCCDRSTWRVPAWRFDGKEIPAGTTTQVERINGGILLISGREDRVWESTQMSERVMARLREQKFQYPYAHLAYEGAGHSIGRPGGSAMDINTRIHPQLGRPLPAGGTPAAAARARTDSWEKMLQFLNANLRDRPEQVR